MSGPLGPPSETSSCSPGRDPQRSLVEVLEARRARRRHRSKINQRKYRAWQRASNNQLQSDVEELQFNTMRLESHVAALHHGQRFHVEEQLVREYIKLFAHGYDHSERQGAFLRMFLAPDVWFVGNHGIDNIISQWEQHVNTFERIHIECSYFKGLYANPDEVAIEARTMVHLLVSNKTVEILLPNIKKRPDLMQRLVGKTLHLPFHIIFIFDATKRVTRIETEANLSAALLEYIDNIEDVAFAQNDSRILQNAAVNVASKTTSNQDENLS